MDKEQKAALAELKKSVDVIVRLDMGGLVRRDELGTLYSFEGARDTFENLFGLYKKLSQSKLDDVPTTAINELRGTVGSVIEILGQIRGFNPKTDANARDSHQKLIKGLQDRHLASFKKLHSVIGYSAREDTVLPELETQSREILIRQKEMLAESEAAMQEVKKEAAKAGVEHHAVHFKLESEGHRKSSRFWLGATIVIAVVAIVFTWVYVYKGIGVISPKQMAEPGVASWYHVYQMVRFALSRILILSILTYGIVWSGRNFLAHKHNEIVNKHRQNALSTFEAFVKASGDNDTKNAVLVEATHCIFTPQTTGYLGKHPEPSSGKSFVEILRQVAPAEKATE